jgi:hypothetical protein
MDNTPKHIGFGGQIPPSLQHVSIYFIQKGFSDNDALDFFNHYESKRWLNKEGILIKNWKITAWEWIWSST